MILSMFHACETLFKSQPIHKIIFYLLLFLLPIQTRILYWPQSAYTEWYFNYHLAFFVYLTDILLITILVSWLIFDPPNLNKFLQNKLYNLIILLFSLILATLFHVKHESLGWYETFKWFEIFALIIYIRETYVSRTQFNIALAILFASAVSQAVIGWSQFHVKHGLGLNILGEYVSQLGTPGLATIETMAGRVIRSYGTMPHPNILGGFLVLGLIAGLYLISKSNKTLAKGIVSSAFAEASADKCGTLKNSSWSTFIISSGIFLTIIGIFATFSRLAWVAASISLLSFTLYCALNKIWPKLIIIAIVIIVSCGTIIFFYQETLRARITDNNPTSVYDRTFFNGVGLDLAVQYPLLGVGVGNYVPAMQDLFLLQPWQYQPAHNIFIFIAAELGILGLALFIMTLYEIFSKLKNIETDTLSIALIFAGVLFLLMGQFDHYFVTIQQGRLMFAVVLGLLAALPNLYAEKSH